MMKKVSSIVSFLCILSLSSNICYSMKLASLSPLEDTYLKMLPREIFYELMNFVIASPYDTSSFPEDRLIMLSFTCTWDAVDKQYNKEVLAARAYFEEMIKALKLFIQKTGVDVLLFKQISSICGALQTKAIAEFLYAGPYGKCCEVQRPYVVAITVSLKAFTDELESYCKKNQVPRADRSPETFKHILSEDAHLNELFDNVQKKHKEYRQLVHDMGPVKNHKVEDVDIIVMKNVANDIYTWCCQTRQSRGNLLYTIDEKDSFKLNIFYEAYVVAHIGTPAALEWLDKYLQEENNKDFASVCLCIAAETNNVALAELALKYGAQINQIRDTLSDNQAYVRAIYYKRNPGFDHKDVREAPFIIVQGEAATRIPLHLACLYGHKEIVQFLLERGADPNKKYIVNPYGQELEISSPLMLATLQCATDIISILREHGAQQENTGERYH